MTHPSHRPILACVLLMLLCAFAPGTVRGLETAPAPASPPPRKDPRDGMDLSVDVGAGLLEFFHLDLTYLHSRTWTVGLGVGFFPINALITKAMGVDDLKAAIDFYGFTLKGNVDTSLVSGQVFGRWYPWNGWFYVQASFALWTLRATARGVLYGESLANDLELDATARVWVPMLGAFAGWRFLWSIGFYLDVGIGVDVLMAPNAKVTFGGSALDQAKLDPETSATLDQARRFLSDGLSKGVNRISADLPVFPTAFIRFGWAFDWW